MYCSGIDGKDSFYPGAIRFYNDNLAVVLLSRDGEVLHRRATDEQVQECIDFLPKVKYPSVLDGYIRFGLPPKSGKSLNYATGEPEGGVSAYNASFDPITGTWLCDGSALMGAVIVGNITKQDVYLILGDEVGVGSDGEPVLSNVQIVSKLIAVDDSPLCTEFEEVEHAH